MKCIADKEAQFFEAEMSSSICITRLIFYANPASKSIKNDFVSMVLFIDNANMISIYLLKCCFTQFSVAGITVVSLPRKYIFDAWFFTPVRSVSGWSGFYGISAACSVLCDDPSIGVTFQCNDTLIFAGYIALNWNTVVLDTQSRW